MRLNISSCKGSVLVLVWCGDSPIRATESQVYIQVPILDVKRFTIVPYTATNYHIYSIIYTM